MNKRTILIGILIVIMLVATVPLHAQDDELTDEQLTEMVVNAYTNLNNLSGYTFSSNQDERQIISSGEGVRQVSLHRNTTRSITNGRLHAGENGASDNVDAVLLQTESIYVNGDIANAVGVTLDFRLIAIDDSIYIRVNDISGSLVSELSEADQATVDENFPTGWIILSGTAAPENNILPVETLADMLSILNKEDSTPISLDTLDFNNLLRLSNNFQITADMIVSIRVAQPNVDDPDLDENENDLIIVIELDATKAFGGLGLENTFNADALAGDAEALLQQILDGMTIRQRIRLVEAGTDPVLLYPDQVATTMIIGTEVDDSNDIIPIEFSENSIGREDTPLALSMRLVSYTQYDSFGSASVITAPLNELAEETTE